MILLKDVLVGAFCANYVEQSTCQLVHSCFFFLFPYSLFVIYVESVCLYVESACIKCRVGLAKCRIGLPVNQASLTDTVVQ